MTLFLQSLTPPDAGQVWTVRPGDVLRVGRSPEADIVVPDERVGEFHLAVTADDLSGWVFKLGGPTPVLLNENVVTHGQLQGGDTLGAGNARWLLALDDKPVASPLDRLAEAILSAPGRHFAVIDASRGFDVVREIEPLVMSCVSLYQGRAQQDMAEYAPYLLSLDGGRAQVVRVLRETWARRQTVFLTAGVDTDAMRSHLRRFLMVYLPDGTPSYFRFYDPAILTQFLLASTADELRAFLGPISQVTCESLDPGVGWGCNWDGSRMVGAEFSLLDGEARGQC